MQIEWTTDPERPEVDRALLVLGDEVWGLRMRFVLWVSDLEWGASNKDFPSFKAKRLHPITGDRDSGKRAAIEAVQLSLRSALHQVGSEDD